MDDPERKPLLVSEFEERVVQTDEMEPEPDTAFLGLFGEIGSLVSALKKRRRDKDAYFGYERAVLEEVGDVLWYASAFARRGGTSLTEVASRVIGDRIPPNQITLGEIVLAPDQPVGDAAIETALLDLAGEAGDIAHRFKNGEYADNADLVRGDLVKLLRPLGRASAAFEVSLDVAGRRNIEKTASRWRAGAGWPPLFDDGIDIDEQLPRSLRIEIYQRPVNSKDFVFQKCNGVLVGDRLTDNHDPPDFYRIP